MLKYQSGAWFPSTLSSVNSNLDVNNIAERYPESEVYKIPEFLNSNLERWVTVEVLEDMGKDIKFLAFNLRKVLIEIDKSLSR